MSLETAIEALTAAVKENTAALLANGAQPAPATTAPADTPKRGRPRATPADTAAASTAPATGNAPVTQAAPATAPQPPAAPAEAPITEESIRVLATSYLEKAKGAGVDNPTAPIKDFNAKNNLAAIRLATGDVAKKAVAYLNDLIAKLPASSGV